MATYVDVVSGDDFVFGISNGNWVGVGHSTFDSFGTVVFSSPFRLVPLQSPDAPDILASQ